MKNLLTALCLCLALSCMAQSTTYQVVNGKVTDTSPITKVKPADKVYQVHNGVTFYQGAKGGVYYWKKSKKTGKAYKCYVKQS